MQDHAPALWQEMQAIATAAKLNTVGFEIGGEYVVNAVQALFKLLKEKKPLEDMAAIKEAARQSRLTDIALVRPDDMQDLKKLRAGWKRSGRQRTAS